MRRRDFFALLGRAAVLQPLAAGAQTKNLPLIGFVSIAPAGKREAAFARGMAGEGFGDGRNVAIEYHAVVGQYERLPAIMADLVARQVALIVAGGPPTARAAKAATATIPIVFLVGSDPVKEGLVASLARPGGNLTGVSILARDLSAKRLELLAELAPQVRTLGLLVNPSNAAEAQVVGDLQAAAAAKGLRLAIVEAQTADQIDAAFARLGELQIGALVVGNDSFLTSQRRQIVALAAHAKIPAIYAFREYADAGGLVSYGTDIAAAYQQVGVDVGRILKGAKPADLPVQQPTKFELVINLKTAKAFGLNVPQSLLARADEVIE